MFNQLQRVQTMKNTKKLFWVGVLGLELILISSSQAADNFPTSVAVQGLIMQSSTLPVAAASAKSYVITFHTGATASAANTVCQTQCIGTALTINNGVFTAVVNNCMPNTSTVAANAFQTPSGAMAATTATGGMSVNAGGQPLLTALGTAAAQLQADINLDYADTTCATLSDNFTGIPIYTVPMALVADVATNLAATATVSPAQLSGAATMNFNTSAMTITDSAGSLGSASKVLGNNGSGQPVLIRSCYSDRHLWRKPINFGFRAEMRAWML